MVGSELRSALVGSRESVLLRNNNSLGEAPGRSEASRENRSKSEMVYPT